VRLRTISGWVFCASCAWTTCGACKIGLKEQVADVHIQEDSVLAGLLRFGYESGVCLGIENPGLDMLNEPVRLDASQPMVSNVVQSLLGGRPYQVSERDGVLLIRSKETVGPMNQLDIIVPDFKIGRISQAWANMALFARLVRLGEPSLQGFAGHLSDRVPNDTVGPFDESGRSARELLTLIVGQSNGASWVSGECSRPAGGRACWSILEYQDEPPIVNSMIASVLSALIRERLDMKAHKP
jgi:hypothetical protein